MKKDETTTVNEPVQTVEPVQPVAAEKRELTPEEQFENRKVKIQKKAVDKKLNAVQLYVAVCMGYLPDSYYEEAVKKGLLRSITLNRMLSIATSAKNEKYIKICIESGAWVRDTIAKKEQQVIKLTAEIAALKKVADEMQATDPNVEQQELNTNTTPLMYATWDNDLEKVKGIIEQGGFINSKNKHGYSALMLACKKNNMDMVKLLVDNGADPNMKNKKGDTASQITNNEEIKTYLQSVITKMEAEKVKEQRRIEKLLEKKNKHLEELKNKAA